MHVPILKLDQDGAPALTFQFDFPPGLGIGPQHIFEPFALGHRAVVAYQTRRTHGWVFARYNTLDFIALLLDSGEELVWVKWGVTDLPGLVAHVGTLQHGWLVDMFLTSLQVI